MIIGRIMFGVSTIAMCATVAVAADGGRRGAAQDGDKMVCRTIKETGSRLSKTRTCRTAAQWAEMRRLTRESIERFQDTKPIENDGS